MALTYDRVSNYDTQLPIFHELTAIFKEFPDEALLEKLKGPKRRGRPGYDPVILWRCYVAYYYLGLDSVSALIRYLEDNPYVAWACGIESSDQIPSQPTFSRFGTKLSKRLEYRLAVKNVLRGLTRRLSDTLPDFGKSVAIDSTDIKAWSNPGKKGKNNSRPRKPKPKGRKPTPNKVSDPDAGWIVKKNTSGKTKYVWGYKVHILCDTTYELPLVVKVAAGNVADVKQASPLLSQARFTTGRFYPDYVLCDAGYSSDPLRRHIKRYYDAEPIIDPNPAHKKAYARTFKTPEWKAIYNRRTAVERLNGRLKAHRRLNSVRVRGRHKLAVHGMMSIIVCQAQAIATESRSSVRRIA